MPGGYEGPSGGRRFGRSGLGRRGPRDSFNGYDSAGFDESFDDPFLTEFSDPDNDGSFGNFDSGLGRRRRIPRHTEEQQDQLVAEVFAIYGRDEHGNERPGASRLSEAEQDRQIEALLEANGFSSEGSGGRGRRPGEFGPGGMRERSGRFPGQFGRGGMPGPRSRFSRSPLGMQGESGRFGRQFGPDATERFASAYVDRRNRRGGFGMGRYPRGGRPSSRDDFDDDGFASEGEFDDSF